MAPTVEIISQPLLTSLINASALCAEIKRNRHCGSVHTQLDSLESSLSDGPSFIKEHSAGLESLEVDEINQTEFNSHTTQLALICGRLDSIAHPAHSSHASHSKPHSPSSKYHKHDHKYEHRSHSQSGSSSDEKEHEHRHHHKHHSNTKPLIFSAFEPIHHHHREVEDPHFHELREEWESVRDGIGRLLAKLKEGKGDGQVEKIVVKEVEKVEVKKEEDGVVEEVVEEVEKIEINEDEKTIEVKEEVKHVDAKDGTHSVVVEIKEDAHRESHEDSVSTLDSGGGSEHNEVKKKILDLELKAVEAKA